MENELERKAGSQSQSADEAHAALLNDVKQTRLQRASADSAVAPNEDLYRWSPTGDATAGGTWQTNPDGSRVQLATCGDGQQHPVGIVYPDGRSTQYGYGSDGRVHQVTNRDANGAIRDQWVSQDGLTFVETHTRAVMQGTITARSDGTAIFQGANGLTIENKSDGSLVTHFSDQQGLHTLISRGDGSTVGYLRMPDGCDHVTSVRFPNTTEVDYTYDSTGNVSQTTDWGAGGPAGGQMLLHYVTPDGQHWHEVNGRAPDLTGSLKLSPDGVHIFYNSGDNTVFVRRPDGQITVQDPTGRVLWGVPGTTTRPPGG